MRKETLKRNQQQLRRMLFCWAIQKTSKWMTKQTMTNKCDWRSVVVGDCYSFVSLLDQWLTWCMSRCLRVCLPRFLLGRSEPHAGCRVFDFIKQSNKFWKYSVVVLIFFLFFSFCLEKVFCLTSRPYEAFHFHLFLFSFDHFCFCFLLTTVAVERQQKRQPRKKKRKKVMKVICCSSHWKRKLWA